MNKDLKKWKRRWIILVTIGSILYEVGRGIVNTVKETKRRVAEVWKDWE